jgi:hypothetical protein
MPSVFLAHSSGDKAVVRAIKAFLADAGLSVWLDEDELAAGDSLFAGINAGLSRVDCVAAFLSPKSITSQWVTRELGAALAAGVEHGLPLLIPVLLPGLDTKDIPSLLRDLVRIRFEEDERAVAHQIIRSVLRDYVDAHEYSLQMTSPPFPSSGKLSWTDKEVRTWLASSPTGIPGVLSPLDREHLVVCETNAPDTLIPDLVMQVQGTGEKVWQQSARWAKHGFVEGRVYLRQGAHQKTTMIMSLYQPLENGSCLCSRRLFTIIP